MTKKCSLIYEGRISEGRTSRFSCEENACDGSKYCFYHRKIYLGLMAPFEEKFYPVEFLKVSRENRERRKPKESF